MKKVLFLATLLATLGFSDCQAQRTTTRPMPEFGRNISFDRDCPKFRVEDLRGKVALLIFFQSW